MRFLQINAAAQQGGDLQVECRTSLRPQVTIGDGLYFVVRLSVLTAPVFTSRSVRVSVTVNPGAPWLGEQGCPAGMSTLVGSVGFVRGPVAT